MPIKWYGSPSVLREGTGPGEYGIEDASAALSLLGYRVAWEGLGGGIVRERE